MPQNIFSSERVTFLLANSTKPTVNTPVCLDAASGKRYVKAASAVTDVIIGAIESVEPAGQDGLWQVTVPVVGPIKEFLATGSIAIGARLVPNSSGILVSQAVNLSGTSFKNSPGISLDSNSSGATTIEVLQMPTYIPV